ncbi:uncharacterized protein LOC127529201 [Erpetoichthys calabaricus]|uniref:uncharacterized protein LOC127529201 n=1 Tax=Erpetoichthys calabaricus TaxID=27687 RepID=UPI00223487CE|nr:uncharacterized protein LOC127529201 [Erpetoichthys calabaricus]
MQQCVLQLFDICRDQSSRNQEGVCLTKEQWTDYCSLKVCSHPSDYRGYDRSLGLCLCQVQDIRAGCGANCKQTSRCVIHLICRETLQLQITYKDTKILTSLSNMKPAVNIRTIQKILQCPALTDFNLPVYLVEVQEQGFLGILNPNPLQVLNLFQETYKWKTSNEFHISNTSDIFGNNFLKNISVHKNVTESLWVEAGGVSENYAKILNPTVCLNIGDILTFVVTKDHYPVYDINNLYNTKSKFDWGDFRSLAEEMNLMNSDLTLFLHSFQQPGVYVLKLSSNQHKKMYIRVMPPGARCYEDRPFFPSIPRHMIHLGIARIPNLLLKPDWPAIAGLMAGAIILFIMCIVLLVMW